MSNVFQSTPSPPPRSLPSACKHEKSRNPVRITAFVLILVPRGRLELPRHSALPPQDSVSTNSTTWARAATYRKSQGLASVFLPFSKKKLVFPSMFRKGRQAHAGKRPEHRPSQTPQNIFIPLFCTKTFLPKDRPLPSDEKRRRHSAPPADFLRSRRRKSASSVPRLPTICHFPSGRPFLWTSAF